MTSEGFFDAIIHQVHVALISAKASAHRAYGGDDRHVRALSHAAQLALAIHDRQWDMAMTRLERMRDALNESDETDAG